MKELKVLFTNYGDFHKWIKAMYTKTPYLMIDCRLRAVRACVETKCKDWETAADRFRKALEGKNDTIDDWFDNHYENIINMFTVNSKDERLCEFTNEFVFLIKDDYPCHENSAWRIFLEIWE